MAVAIVVIIVAVVVVLVLVGWMAMQRRQRSRGLREQFGSEYEQAVEETGDRKQAEADLDARRQRVESFEIVELRPDESASFTERWQTVQANFVDRPSEAITEAETLVTQVMVKRGYPMADFDQRAADVSVDHPEVVSEYREARAIAVKNADGNASTEDLRQAMLHYRALFDELLGKRAAA